MRIFLVGFSGSGKTHWGEKWSEAFNLHHYDIDAWIASQHGKTVSALFEEKGEQYFRKMEKEALDLFIDKENMIMSCGGGLPCFFDNMERMNEAGITIYLKAEPDFLYDRIIGEIEERPLLKVIPPAEIFDYINNKLAERVPFYEKAKITLDASRLTIKSLADILVSLPKI